MPSDREEGIDKKNSEIPSESARIYNYKLKDRESLNTGRDAQEIDILKDKYMNYINIRVIPKTLQISQKFSISGCKSG